MSTRMEQLRDKLARERAAAEAAKGALSPEDVEELALRKQVRAAEEEREKAEQEARELDLDRREEAAQEQHGPDAKITSLTIEHYPDTFVIKHDQEAYERWEAGIAKAITNKKVDKKEVSRAYAAAVVIDWNGITDFSIATTNGHELNVFLKKHGGIVSSIVNAAAKLAGAFQEDRKS